jgi:peptidoglycan L-alanyl-D-glutamate endopeptidase CwlK|tara:strand:+ start:1760 stop:2152 length:393 start_codon:yes stop_codon:yes gene_type:complete
MSYKFGENSLKNRAGINPDLIEILDRAVEISIYDFGVPEHGGVRSAETQKKLFDQGVSKADGTTHKSFHQTANAVDVYAYVNGQASWNHEHLAVVAAAMLQASSELGIPLEWGGLWTGFCDRPHFQLAKD